MNPIYRKRVAAALLACMLLLGCTLVPASAAEVQGSAVIMPRVSGRLNHSLESGITPVTQALYYDTGDTITYTCTYTPESSSVDFGYIDSSKVFHYLNCTSGSFSKSMEFDKPGQYTLAIRNNESYTVTVTGTVKY